MGIDKTLPYWTYWFISAITSIGLLALGIVMLYNDNEEPGKRFCQIGVVGFAWSLWKMKQYSRKAKQSDVAEEAGGKASK